MHKYKNVKVLIMTKALQSSVAAYMTCITSQHKILYGVYSSTNNTNIQIID